MPRLNLPLIAEGQAQPHVTHNEALDLIERFWSKTVLSATTTAPPEVLSDGLAYLIPSGATGFDASEGQIALYAGGIWHALDPEPGWRVHVLDEGRNRIYDGSAWRAGDVIGAMGSTLGLATFEAELDLASESSAPALIPARAIVLGVTSWTIEAVVGASSYQVGLAGELPAFALELTLGEGERTGMGAAEFIQSGELSVSLWANAQIWGALQPTPANGSEAMAQLAKQARDAILGAPFDLDDLVWDLNPGALDIEMDAAQAPIGRAEQSFNLQLIT